MGIIYNFINERHSIYSHLMILPRPPAQPNIIINSINTDKYPARMRPLYEVNTASDVSFQLTLEFS